MLNDIIVIMIINHPKGWNASSKLELASKSHYVTFWVITIL